MQELIACSCSTKKGVPRRTGATHSTCTIAPTQNLTATRRRTRTQSDATRCHSCGGPPRADMSAWSPLISSIRSDTKLSQLFGTAHAKMDGGRPVSPKWSMSCITSPPTMPLKNIMRSTPNAEVTADASACTVSSAAPSVPPTSPLEHVTRRTASASMASRSARHRRVSSGVNPTSRIASGPNRPSATPPGAASTLASISRKSARATTVSATCGLRPDGDGDGAHTWRRWRRGSEGVDADAGGAGRSGTLLTDTAAPGRRGMGVVEV
mmetsp:Transcript_26707/g.42785  ORF Transcript_26707/g.42785 Transcript_26707/m.42785 type:complete len:267 (-) Transcript_26707:43-843(-)